MLLQCCVSCPTRAGPTGAAPPYSVPLLLPARMLSLCVRRPCPPSTCHSCSRLGTVLLYLILGPLCCPPASSCAPPVFKLHLAHPSLVPIAHARTQACLICLDVHAGMGAPGPSRCPARGRGCALSVPMSRAWSHVRSSSLPMSRAWSRVVALVFCLCLVPDRMYTYRSRNDFIILPSYCERATSGATRGEHRNSACCYKDTLYPVTPVMPSIHSLDWAEHYRA